MRPVQHDSVRTRLTPGSSFVISLIGSPLRTLIHEPIVSQGALCFVHTDRNIIAALNCRNGEIIWRQLLAEKEEIIDLVAKDSSIMSLTVTGSLQSWDARTGHIVWSVHIADPISMVADGAHVLVRHKRGISWVSVSGDLSQHEVDDVGSIALHSGIVYYSKGNEVQSLVCNDGSLVAKKTIDGRRLSYTSRASVPIILSETSKGRIGIDTLIGDRYLELDTSTENVQIEYQGTSLLLISGTTVSHVHHIDLEAAKVVSTWDIPRKAGSLLQVQYISDTPYVTRVSVHSSAGTIEVWDSHGSLKSTMNVRLKENADLVDASVELQNSKDGNIVARALVASSDSTIAMWRDSDVDWSRDEALSNARTVVFVKLTLPRSGQQMIAQSDNSVMVKLIARLRRQAAALRQLVTPTTNSSSIFTQLAEDHFGLKQFAIALDPTGKAWAIDTVTQQIVWSNTMIDGADLIASSVVQPGAYPSLRVSYNVAEGQKQTFLIDCLTSEATIETEIVAHPFVQIHTDERSVSRTESGIEIWSFQLPSGDRLVRKHKKDVVPIASVGRVLGDRGVLYKYLEENVVAVISVNDQAHTLTAWLLHAANGKILHHSTHDQVGTKKSIQLLLSENWLAYHFWSELTRSYQMIISEFYQGPTNEKSDDLLHVTSRSFIYNQEISAMAATTTKQGITSRDLIVALQSQQVTSISRRLLDPRRPDADKVTAYDKEEQLIPYDPVLPIDPKAVLSHTLEVMGIMHIVTTSTLLESTSLVCAFGLDLFFTRVTPSMPFDVLSDSFSKFQIIVSLLLLVAAIFITNPMANKRILEKRWIG